MTDEDGKLRFKKMFGGYAAENHHRYYAIFSTWGWREDLRKNYFIWNLEVREKSDVLGHRTIVGLPPIYVFETTTRNLAIAEAQRLEDSVQEALAQLRNDEGN